MQSGELLEQLVQSGVPKDLARRKVVFEIMKRAGQEGVLDVSLSNLLTELGLDEADVTKSILASYLQEPLSKQTNENSTRVPIYETKLIKTIRFEPVELEQVERLLKDMGEDAKVKGEDPPSESSVIRMLVRRGLEASPRT